MKKAILFGLIICFGHRAAQSQHWLGINQSNYSGSNHFYYNTARAVSAPNSVSANAFGGGLHFENNYLTYQMPFTFTQWVTGNVPNTYKDENGKIAFKSDWFEENLNGKAKNVDLYGENRGPATLYNYNRKIAVGFFSRTRLGLQVANVEEDLARVFRHGLDSSNNIIYDPPNAISYGTSLEDGGFSLNMTSFSEIGLGVAVSLFENTYLKVSVGGNIKLLMGNGAGYVNNRNLRFRVEGSDSVLISEADFEYAYVQPAHFSSLNPINFFNGSFAGYGMGYDLSGYMELRRPLGRVGQRVQIPDVQYYAALGVSLLDVGGITYKDQVQGKKVTLPQPVTWVPGPQFASAWSGGLESGLNYTDSLANALFNMEEMSEITTTLPTALSIFGDFRIIPKLFVGFQWFQSLKSKDSPGLRRPSGLNVMPRFEAKAFEVSVPLSLYNDYRNATVGFFLRFGPFFMGSDNLVSSINTSSFRGLNYYAGISQGFGNSLPKQ